MKTPRSAQLDPPPTHALPRDHPSLPLARSRGGRPVGSGRPARIAPLLFIAATLGCGGAITLGTADAGARAPADAGGMPPVDGGMTTSDGGTACTPSYPAAWPFARDVATYRAKFYDRTTTDGCPVCHASLGPPFMPSTAAGLDDPNNLNRAIDELWTTAQPGPPTALLIRWHSPTSAGGDGQPPIFTSEQAARYGTVLRELGGCP